MYIRIRQPFVMTVLPDTGRERIPVVRHYCWPGMLLEAFDVRGGALPGLDLLDLRDFGWAEVPRAAYESICSEPPELSCN